MLNIHDVLHVDCMMCKCETLRETFLATSKLISYEVYMVESGYGLMPPHHPRVMSNLL